MKYCVTVTRTGCVFIEADSESEAMYIADHLCTNSVNWSDDWEPTDCVEDETILDYMCITEPEFE